MPVHTANPVTVIIPVASGSVVLPSGYNTFNVNQVFLPSGGTDGQVVTKSGSINYLADWEDVPASGGDDVLIGDL